MGDITTNDVLMWVIYFFVGSSIVSMIRVVIGPSVVDRMIGLNMVSAQILALLVLLAIREDRSIYLDVALVYDIFGFVGILAITRYFGGRPRASTDDGDPPDSGDGPAEASGDRARTEGGE